MTSQNDPAVTHVQSAELALDTYQKYAISAYLPSPPDRRYADALIAELISDLRHYAEACGFDFTEILANVHAAHADDPSPSTRYAIGDEVRVITRPERCGTITGTTTTREGEQLYHVHVAGVPYMHAERASDLEPATSFPVVSTPMGVVATARRAEEVLIELAGGAPQSDPGGVPTAWAACDRLTTALSWWSGTSYHELTKELNSKIARRRAGHQAPEAQRDADPARLAGQSFPYDLRDGVPQAVDGTSAPATTEPTTRPNRSPGGGA